MMKLPCVWAFSTLVANPTWGRLRILSANSTLFSLLMVFPAIQVGGCYWLMRMRHMLDCVRNSGQCTRDSGSGPDIKFFSGRGRGKRNITLVPCSAWVRGTDLMVSTPPASRAFNRALKRLDFSGKIL